VITINLAEWIAATPKPSTLPADAAAASSFIVLPVNALPAGSLPIAAPAPGTDPAAAPAAPYTPARAADPIYGYSDGGSVLIAFGVASSPGQDPLALTGAPDRPAPVEKKCSFYQKCGFASAWDKTKSLAGTAGRSVAGAATSAWNYARNHPVDVALNAAMIALAFVPVGGEVADAAIIGWRAERGIQTGITLARTAETEPEAATLLRETGEALKSCLRHSFAPTTPVLLADGTTKPIDQVHVGDKVLTTDPDTGKSSPQTVTNVSVHHDTDLMDLIVQAAGTTAILHTTEHHPFWDETRHAWTDTDHLTPGDRLHTDNGTTATVVATVALPASGDMWDLTVNHIHDFYVTTTLARARAYDVAASGTSVLVHNTNCGTFGHLDPSGRLNIPNASGVYRIEVGDGPVYIGKAADIHNRIHGAFRGGGALNDLGYVPSDVVRLSWIEMSGATESELFYAEDLWINSEGGIGGLANRINSPGGNLP